jgi:hypothetical protein
MENKQMIGGNSQNGWRHRTRNPGAFDIVEHKQRLNASRGLMMWIASIRALAMEDIMSLMGCSFLDNKQENPTLNDKESEIDFRRAYF